MRLFLLLSPCSGLKQIFLSLPINKRDCSFLGHLGEQFTLSMTYRKVCIPPFPRFPPSPYLLFRQFPFNHNAFSPRASLRRFNECCRFPFLLFSLFFSSLLFPYVLRSLLCGLKSRTVSLSSRFASCQKTFLFSGSRPRTFPGSSTSFLIFFRLL